MDPNMDDSRTLREEIRENLIGLTELEREVITRRFGLIDRTPQTLAEVGARLHLTVAKVRHTEAKALETLRSGPSSAAS